MKDLTINKVASIVAASALSISTWQLHRLADSTAQRAQVTAQEAQIRGHCAKFSGNIELSAPQKDIRKYARILGVKSPRRYCNKFMGIR